MKQRRGTTRDSCWPDAVEELLLSAAIRDGEAAVEAWRDFQARADIQSLGYTTQQLLPQVYRNLARLELRDDLTPMLKGAYRFAWVRNQSLFAAAGGAITELRAAGIDTLVLKGTAAALLDYGDAGARVMADVDVLVRPNQIERAMAVLADMGWRSSLRRPEALLDVVTAHAFRGGDGRSIDLHWYAMARRLDDGDLWAGAVPLTVGRASTLAPNAAARMVHACVHGAEAGEPPHLRWILDSAAVVAGGEIVWPDVVELARRREVSAVLARTLGYLREQHGVDVPAGVVEALRDGPHSRFERAAERAAMRPRTVGSVTLQEWFRFRRMTGRRSWRSFLRYLQLSMGHERRRDLARHVVRRLVHGRTP